MTTKECYKLMNADYENALARLVSDSLIRRLLLKFSEAKDIPQLQNALDTKDYESAFRIAHSLKGVSLNLSFTSLTASSSALCDELRGGNYTDKIAPLLETVIHDYHQILSAIEKLNN